MKRMAKIGNRTPDTTRLLLVIMIAANVTLFAFIIVGMHVYSVREHKYALHEERTLGDELSIRIKRGVNNDSRFFHNQKSLVDSLRYSKLVDGDGNGVLFLAFEIAPQQTSGNPELKAIQLNELQAQLTQMFSSALKQPIFSPLQDTKILTSNRRGLPINKSVNFGIKGKPNSCYDLNQLGHTLSGFYMVQGRGNSVGSQIYTIYCDFTSPRPEDIEEMVGYNDVKTSLATYFYVQRKSYYSKSESVIPFDVQLMNIGGGMNLATGIFTAPVAGRYFFTLSGLAQKLETYLHLMLNGGIVGTVWGERIGDSYSLQSTLDLELNDQVSLFLVNGIVGDKGPATTHFTGMLIEEELEL